MKHYQDMQERGRKSCSFHWDVIKPYLQGKKTILDVGSNLGYLTIRIAQEFSNVIVGSFEMHKVYAFEQRELLIQNAIKNVILCWHKFDSRVIEYLWKSHEAVDLILLQFNFHRYNLWEVEDLLRNIRVLTPEIIIEFPYSDKNILKKYFQRVEFISKHLFRVSNSEISRLADDGHRMNWNQKDGWRMDQKDRKWISGLGFQNLAMWGIIYPSLEWFLEASNSAYSNLKKHFVITDMTINNLLFRLNELVAIDYSDRDTLKLYDKSFKEYSSEDWYTKGIQALEDQIKNIIHEKIE